MSEEYGSDYISIIDEDGSEIELEHLTTLEYQNTTYMSFLPADTDEDDEDYGIIILKVIEENGEELFATVDDETELQTVYDLFTELLFEDEDDDEDDDSEDSDGQIT